MSDTVEGVNNVEFKITNVTPKVSKPLVQTSEVVGDYSPSDYNSQDYYTTV